MRHGETDWNIDRKMQGQSDIPLNQNGVDLAEKTSEALKDINFDYFFSSPLKRAYKTCEIMRRNRDKEIITDNRLIEMSFGIYEGVPSESMAEVRNAFFNTPDTYEAPENGESYYDVCDRTKDFIDNVLIPLSKKEPDCKVLLTAHGALNKCLLKNFCNREVRDIWATGFLKNCSISLLEINGNDITLLEEGKLFA